MSNLDRWFDEQLETNHTFLRSILSQDDITLDSLRERIIELETMKDKILYELERLRSFVESE